jgi:hypothetical protein
MQEEIKPEKPGNYSKFEAGSVTRNMKRLSAFLMITLATAVTAGGQNMVRDFGNNRVTTSSIDISSDGRYLLVGGYARAYRLSDGQLELRTVEKDLVALDDFSYVVDISRDNRSFVVSKLRRIEIWDLAGRMLKSEVKDTRLVPEAVAFSPTGDEVAYMRKGGELVFVSSATGQEIYTIQVTSGDPSTLVFSPDGNHLAIGTKKDGMVLYDVNSRSASSHPVNLKTVELLRISPDGSWIAASSSDGRVWLARFPSLEQVNLWQAHTSTMPIGSGAANPLSLLSTTPISFHPSGQFIASGGLDKMIRVWSIPECEMKYEWAAHNQNVTSLMFTPDGSTLASGSANYVLKGGDDTRLWAVNIATPTIRPAQEPAVQQIVTKQTPTVRPVMADWGKRLALVIGNSNYSNMPLTNPVNDARDMKAALEQYGFDVIKYENLTQAQMKKAMDEFGEALKKYEVGLFFYAGHGIQAKGYNYLIPIDADLRSEEQVEYDCVQADRVLALLEASGTKVNIIILDACRNNPFERSWTRSTSGRGLAYMNAPRGTLIAYATAPGRTASDGSGRNGLYTSAILESIRIPNITILQMFQNVRSIVSGTSADQQIPWESTSLTGDFYFSRDTIR